MKILLVTDAYTHLTNGVAVVVATLYNTFRAKGHDVRVLTVSGDRSAHHEGDVYYMPSFKVPLYPDVRMSLVHRHPFLTELKEWKPDIVHIHSEASASRMAKSIAKATGARIVMTWHTDYAKFAFHNHYSMGIVHFSAKNLMKAAYHGTSIITVPSYKAKRLLDGYGLKHPNVVIPNGIILSRFQKELTDEDKHKMLEQYHIPQDSKIMVIVSRLSAEKNISEIIEFFPSLLEKEPKLHLLIAGIGPDKHHLEQLRDQLGLSQHITFVGFVPPEETYRCYKLGRIFFSASTFEMHSLTYLEAMACGLPLVCRDDTCLEGVLTDGFNGYIYHDKEEFVTKTLRLLQDDALCGEMSAHSLQRSENFSEEAFADKMLALYRQLLSLDHPAKRRKKK